MKFFLQHENMLQEITRNRKKKYLHLYIKYRDALFVSKNNNNNNKNLDSEEFLV